MKHRFKKYFSEFLGTMLFVFFGCGGVIVFGSDYKKGVGYLISAFAAALAFVALAYGISRFSGCHLNPAVSLGMLMTGKIDLADFAGYTLSQILGAFGGMGVLTGVFFGHTGRYGANVFYDAEPIVSIVVEVLLTMVFVSVFLFTDKENNSEISKGLALLLTVLFGMHLTGASLNPAKSIASAVFAGKDALGELWVFVVAPMFGAFLAALIYKLFKEDEEKTENAEEAEVISEEATSTEALDTSASEENI